MEDRPIRDPYVISEALCDFWNLCAFRNHVVSDFWARSETKVAFSLSTFRFLGIYFPIFEYVTDFLQNNYK